MLTLQATQDRVMVSGFNALASPELRQLARREVRAVLDPVSACREPDRLYYSNDGRLDAASWGIAQGTVNEAMSRVRATCARNALPATCDLAG